jgi:thioredoxin-related protein
MKKVTCKHCEKRKKETAQQEEFQLAVLVSLVPLMAFTLFGQIGLF